MNNSLVNESNKIGLRQICFVFLALMPITKIALLPSILARTCEQDLWISCAINFTLDFIVLISILLLQKRHSGTPFYTIIKDSVGEPIAKIVFSLYTIYFFIKALIPLLEQQDYIENALYEIMPNPITFYPIFIVSFFASLKGLKTLGRCADISIWFTLLGFIITFYLAIPSCDLTNILPIMTTPIKTIVSSSYKSVFWFSDSLYMLIFLGHFDDKKPFIKKIAFSFLGSAIVTIIFMIVFYGVFGKLSSGRLLPIPEMTLFAVSVSNSLRFDFVAIFLLLFSQVYAIILPLFLSIKCLCRVITFNNLVLPALIINTLLMALLIILSNRIFTAIEIIQKYFNIFFVVLGYILPPLFLLLPKRRKNEKVKG